MSEDSARRAFALHRKVQTFAGRACAFCGQSDALVLQRFRSAIACRRCARLALGRSAHEAHHVAGRSHAPETASIDSNLHAQINVLQAARRAQSRTPEDADWGAAIGALRGAIDVLYAVLRILERTAAVGAFREAAGGLYSAIRILERTLTVHEKEDA